VVSGPLTDGCGRTDGIAAWAGDLGTSFPLGAFVCQDNTNSLPGTSGNQNFKIVPLERIVPLGAAVNRPPAAVLDPPSCTGLSCSFDASASWDPDGDEITFAWDLGDGSEAEGATVEHTYAQPGLYPVRVEVRDTQGSAATVRTTIEVSLEPEVPIGFRADAGAVTNATSIAPRVPSAAEPGDALLLTVAANRSDAVLAAPAGWQDLGRQADESMQSRLWVRVAQTGDADSTVRVTSSRSTKMVAHVLVYTGTDPVTPVAAAVSAGETGKSTSHQTPVVTTSPDSWVVSLWSNKSSSTTGWTAPPGVAVRQYLGTSGSGRVTMLAADSGGPVGSSTYGGLTAIASQAGSMATMWSIALTQG
jgi:PKD repeat protein